MEKNFVLNGNREIAHFMGLIETNISNHYGPVDDDVAMNSLIPFAMPYDEARFDRSWDWLMPVIKEIQIKQKEAQKKRVGLALPMIIGIEKSFELEIDIEKTYKKVVIFCRWFNRNNK